MTKMTDRELTKTIDSMISKIESIVNDPLYELIYMHRPTQRKVEKMWRIVDRIIEKAKTADLSNDIEQKIKELERLKIKWGR